MRDCRLLLVSICCSTSLNSTNCCVNALVSIGDSGSWFCSCVVRSVRNVLKFEVKFRTLLALLPVLVLPLEFVWLVPSEVRAEAALCVLATVMGLDLDVESAVVAA